MKILQISNRIPYPLNEGGTIGIYNYTRGFHEAGCEVVLLAQAAEKHNVCLKEASAVLSKFARVEFFPINTDVRIMPAFANLFSSKSYNIQRFWSDEFNSAIAEILQKEQFDIIQVEGTFPALYTPTILKFKGKSRVILRQHNVEYQIWARLAKNARNPLKKWYFNLLSARLKRFESEHLNQFDAVVPVTEDDGHLFKLLGCHKPIFASPSGIDIDYWKPNPELEQGKWLYHMGSLEWMPNAEAVDWFLNEVWPLALAKDSDLKFFIAGKGMSDEMRSRKIDGVEMAGEVPDAAAFAEDKSITVVPLKSGSGIRLKILEAMAAGKVVISTTIGSQGIAYTAGENMLIADAPETFAEAILKVANDTALATKLKANGRKLIESRYSNQQVIIRLLDFYKTLD